MTTRTYGFQEQLRAGHSGEARLDAFFGQWYHIIPATPAQQRLGIDRIFIDRETRIQTAIEYKTDWTASRTGNAFVELVSVDTTNKPGWAYSSTAERLAYFLPDDDLLYLLTFTDLRQQLPRWCASHPARSIPNHGYATRGILVPLHEFERIATDVCVV